MVLSKVSSLPIQNIICINPKKFTIIHQKGVSDFQKQPKFMKFFCATTNSVSAKAPLPEQQAYPRKRLSSHQLLNQYRASLDPKKSHQHNQKEELLYERPTGSGMILFNTLFTLAAVRRSSSVFHFF
jgi:hypothetical protein